MVESTVELLTAFESATLALVVAVLMSTDCETFFESLVVCRVEMTTESETALESAVDTRVDCETSLLVATDRTRLSSFSETLPVEIWALTALSTEDPAVTRETAPEVPAV